MNAQPHLYDQGLGRLVLGCIALGIAGWLALFVVLAVLARVLDFVVEAVWP